MMAQMRVAVLGLALVLTACVGAGQQGDPADIVTVRATEIGHGPGDGVGGGPAVLQPADCPDGLDDSVECGFLVVAEKRSDPTSQVIEVAWMLIPSDGVQDGAPEPLLRRPPLVVIPDGPGDSGLAEAEAWLRSPLRDQRDIVLLDPRGTGRSFPLLDCGQPPRPGALPLDLVEDCRRQLVADGVDLSAYDTSATATDIADLREALGLGQVDLLGIGHGARVALAMVRDHRAGIRAVVLDSPVPSEVDVYDDRARDAQATLNRLLDLCVQTTRCADRFGDLRPAVEQMVDDLNAAAAAAEEDVVSGDDLIVAAIAAMRGLAGPEVVPVSLQQAVDGDPADALARLQEAAVTGAAVPRSQFSEGLRLSSECRDEVPFTPAGDPIEERGLSPVGVAVARDVAALLDACALWSTGRADAREADAVEAEVFALFLSGEFDPLSPAAWGAGAAARVEGAVVVQVDGAGHRVHDVDDCTLGIVAAFLARPGATVDDGCAVGRTVDFDLS